VTLPFVSRARFEDACRKNEELETERKRLLDRIALLSGQPPLYSDRPAAAAAPAMVRQPERAEGEGALPARRHGRLTRQQLLDEANRAAQQRARVAESPGIVAEMNAKQAAAWPVKAPTKPAAVAADFARAEVQGREQAVRNAD
jgi:hypothetical protein